MEKWCQMRTISLSCLFEVGYGTKLDLNKMTKLPDVTETSIAFVGRSSKNNGVSCEVTLLADVAPLSPGLITVALGGALLSAFVQLRPFYTAQNVAVLKPRYPMNHSQMVYYCIAINRNKFRYSAFGREANRTLKDVEIPILEEMPDWVSTDFADKIYVEETPMMEGMKNLSKWNWHAFSLGSLFNVEKGKRLTKVEMINGDIPFVGASDSDNGYTAFIGQSPIHNGNTISVCYNGSVGEAFFQPVPFWASDDVNVLYSKGFNLNIQRALFICTLIRREKYRFNYGRKWHLERMKLTEIQLPTRDGVLPDWEGIDAFMNTLAYSNFVFSR